MSEILQTVIPLTGGKRRCSYAETLNMHIQNHFHQKLFPILCSEGILLIDDIYLT